MLRDVILKHFLRLVYMRIVLIYMFLLVVPVICNGQNTVVKINPLSLIGLQLIKNHVGMEVFIGPGLNYTAREIITSTNAVNETQLDFSDSNNVLKLLGRRGIFPSVRAGLTLSGAF